MTYNLIAYGIYAGISIFTIGYVGKLLHSNGRYFVLQIILDELFVDFINDRLLAGYYLVNIGFTLFTLSNWEKINNAQELAEAICTQTGTLYMILGVLHFINILSLQLYAKLNEKELSSDKKH